MGKRKIITTIHVLKYPAYKINSLQYRCFIAPLEHVSDIHLYYNMVSLAWKGMKLEKSNRYGTLGFIGLLVMFAILTGVVYSVLSYAAAELLEDVSYIHQCSVGFSGILFALKVVANSEDPAGSQGVSKITVNHLKSINSTFSRETR